MNRSAGIVVIGNEILTGKVRDSNSAFLIQELRALGTPVVRVLVIPDEVETIAQAVRDFSARFPHVITCGGVGPTLDDVTLEALGVAFGRPLYEDQDLARVVREHYGAETTEAHLKLARVPAGSTLLWPPGIRWPLLFVENVLVLPGDPGILQRKFGAVRERYRERPYHLRRIFTRHEEGRISPHLDAVHAAHPEVALGSYPVYEGADYAVQVTLEGKDEAAVDRATRALLALLDPAAIVRVQ